MEPIPWVTVPESRRRVHRWDMWHSAVNYKHGRCHAATKCLGGVYAQCGNAAADESGYCKPHQPGWAERAYERRPAVSYAAQANSIRTRGPRMSTDERMALRYWFDVAGGAEAFEALSDAS